MAEELIFFRVFFGGTDKSSGTEEPVWPRGYTLRILTLFNNHVPNLVQFQINFENDYFQCQPNFENLTLNTRR